MHSFFKYIFIFSREGKTLIHVAICNLHGIVVQSVDGIYNVNGSNSSNILFSKGLSLELAVLVGELYSFVCKQWGRVQMFEGLNRGCSR